MHILLVNDDGITAVGITALLKEAAARGHRVTMAAPDRQQSAASHRLTLSEPIMMHPFTTGLPGVEAYAIKGSPADCVRVALLGGLVTDPVDVVVSGINNGLNAGMDAHYSGTLGAASATDDVRIRVASRIITNRIRFMRDASFQLCRGVRRSGSPSPGCPCSKAAVPDNRPHGRRR